MRDPNGKPTLLYPSNVQRLYAMEKRLSYSLTDAESEQRYLDFVTELYNEMKEGSPQRKREIYKFFGYALTDLEALKEKYEARVGSAHWQGTTSDSRNAEIGRRVKDEEKTLKKRGKTFPFRLMR